MRLPKLLPFFAASLLLVSQLGAAQALPGTSVDRIIAVVDEDVILASELAIGINNIRAQYRGREDQLPPANVLERQVLERLVMVKLQVARAESTGIRIGDTELNQVIQGVATQSNLNVDQLREQLAKDGISFEEYRRTLREQLQLRRLQQRVVQSRVNISEAEIDQLLAQRQQIGQEIRLANILVALPDGATPEQVSTAQTKITGIKGLLDRNELDFRAAAIRYSDDRNALDGGDLGWRDPNSVPPRFAELLRAMQPGQVSEPIRGPSGFQLIQLVETRQSGPQSVTEYQADNLLIRVDDIVGEQQALKKIEDLRAKIEAGEDFAKIAKENSDDTFSRARGGRLDWFEANNYGTAIGEQLARLQDGELSPPFRSDTGWHVIRKIASRSQDVTEKSRRNAARQILGERKADEEYERFLRQMRAEAYVESRLEKSSS